MININDKTKREQAQVFRKAAVLIESMPKLAKVIYRDESDCSMCAVGALAVANGDLEFINMDRNYPENTYQYTDVPAATKYLKTEEGQWGCEASSWEEYNNRSDVDKEHVASAFRKVARAIEHGDNFDYRPKGSERSDKRPSNKQSNKGESV